MSGSIAAAGAVDDTARWQRLACGDKQAREELLSEHMQLVFWLARRYQGRGLEWDDLCQIGAIGLLKAIDNFRPEYNNKFSTYAVPMIMGELKRALRDDGLLHVSRSYKEKLAKIATAAQRLLVDLGRDATLSELSCELNMPEGEVAEVLSAAQKPVSLASPVGDDKEGGEGLALQNLLAAGDTEDIWVRRLSLQEAFSKLPQRLRYIMEARYFREETQAAIAAKHGVSQVQVSRLEKQALGLLRDFWLGGADS